VSSVPTLVIHYNAASVHVLTGGAGQVSLHATKQVRALTGDQAQRTLDGLTVLATQTGNVVTIEVNTGRTFEFNPFSDRQVDVTLTTPSNTNVSVTGNAGSLDATGLTGKLTAQVNAGSVTMDTMTLADGSSLRTNAGSLTLDGAMQQGASLTVTVNAGSVDLTLPKDTSAHVNASASAGSVDVTGWNLAKIESGAHETVIGDLNPNPTGSIVIRVSAGSATLTAA
jgi:hypothetical protein